MRFSSEAIVGRVDESCPQLVAGLGGDAGLGWTSPAWHDVMGHLPEALFGLQPHQLAHPEDAAEVEQLVRAVFDGGPAATFIHRFRDGSGTWRFLEWTVHRHQPASALWVAVDVTDRCRREAERKRRISQLLMAEELAGVGHWWLDLGTEALSWSPQVFAIHGRDPALGEPDLGPAIAAYHPDDRAMVQAAVGRAVAEGEPFAFQARLIGEDGVERRVVSRGRAETAGGKVVGVFGVFQDLTETYDIQRRLHRAERLAAVGTLAASVAHEINNPLSYVQLNIEFLLEEIQNLQPSSTRRLAEVELLLDDLGDGVRRIARIVAGLSGFSRAREAEIGPVELGVVVRNALRLCQNEVDHISAVRVAEPDGPLTVMADESQLVQVVVNLLINATHAARPDAPLVLEVSVLRRDGGWACIEVRDNGVGMPDRVRSRVTEPFFTTRESGAGTGLGLFVSSGIAEALGGRLEVASQLGRGTTVTVVLPERSDVHLLPPPVEVRPKPPRWARVLVVDDQLRVARSVARAIRPHRAVIETDPVRALERLGSPEFAASFDLILCDLMMPVMHGQQLYERAPAWLQPRFVFMTGGAFTPGAERFASMMGDRVIAKPPDRETLHRRIEEALLAQVPVVGRASAGGG